MGDRDGSRSPPSAILACSVDPVVVAFRFFDGAPLIRVPGRLHPVEVRYVPTAADNDIQEVSRPVQLFSACSVLFCIAACSSKCVGCSKVVGGVCFELLGRQGLLL